MRAAILVCMSQLRTTELSCACHISCVHVAAWQSVRITIYHAKKQKCRDNKKRKNMKPKSLDLPLRNLRSLKS